MVMVSSDIPFNGLSKPVLFFRIARKNGPEGGVAFRMPRGNLVHLVKTNEYCQKWIKSNF